MKTTNVNCILSFQSPVFLSFNATSNHCITSIILLVRSISLIWWRVTSYHTSIKPVRISKMWIRLCLAFPCSSFYLHDWSGLLPAFLFSHSFSHTLSFAFLLFSVSSFSPPLLFLNSQTTCWFIIFSVPHTVLICCFSSANFSFCGLFHNHPFIRACLSSVSLKVCHVLIHHFKQSWAQRNDVLYTKKVTSILGFLKGECIQNHQCYFSSMCWNIGDDQ